MSYQEKFVQTVLSYQYLIMAGLALAILFLTPGIRYLKIENDVRNLLNQNSQAYRSYRETLNDFGSEKMVFVMVKDEQIFIPSRLRDLKQLETRIAKKNWVKKPQSIFSAPVPQDKTAIKLQPIFDSIPDQQDRINEKVKTLRAIPVAKKRLIAVNTPSILLGFRLKPSVTPKQFNQITRQVKAEIKNLRYNYQVIEQMGMPYITYSLNKQIAQNLPVIVTVLMLSLLGGLFFMMGTLHAILYPTITASFSVLFTLGFMGYAGYPLSMLTWIVPILIIAIGSTEDMHILSAFFHTKPGEQYNRIQKATKEVGGAIILTGVTTIIGFAASVFGGVEALANFGISAAFGMAANFIVTILVAPIYLQYPNGVWRHSSSRLGNKIADFVIQNGWSIVAISAIITVSLSWFIPSITVDNSPLAFFNEKGEVKKRLERFNNNFYTPSSFYVILEGSHGFAQTKNGIQAIKRVETYLTGQSKYKASNSIADYIYATHDVFSNNSYDAITDQHIAQYLLMIPRDVQNYYVTADRTKASIIVFHDIRTTAIIKQEEKKINQWLNNNLPRGIDHTLTGEGPLMARAGNAATRHQIQSVFTLVAIMFFILLLVFNFKGAVICTYINAIVLLIMYGCMGLFNLPMNLPATALGVIMIGVIIDDTLHMVIQARRAGQADITSVIHYIINRELRPVLTTTVAMALGFLVLILAPFPPIVTFGKLAAFAFLVAVLCDLLLLPTLIGLFNNPFKQND